MPFRLYNVLIIFQQLINYILHDHLREFVIVYLDNVVIYSKSIKKHIKYLD